MLINILIKKKPANNFFLTVLFFLLLLISPCVIFAASDDKKNKSNDKKITLPSVLKADEIHGDKKSNTLNAIGNVELIKDGNTIYADTMSYDKNNKNVKADGNILIRNFQLGNMNASHADVKDDLSGGYFDDATLVFNDGSYIKSPRITKINKNETSLADSIFSICPNPLIADNNKEAGQQSDLFSLKSTKTIIDKEKNYIKIKHAIFRIHDVPVFYSPYIKAPIPTSERKSGVLSPSYVNNSRLGFGLRLPYYFNIAPDRDLTTTLQYHPGGNHIIVSNQYRHLFESGLYDMTLELANNKKPNSTINDSIDVNNKERKSVRWYVKSHGNFALSKNMDLNVALDHVGDKSYLRDYHNSLVDNTLSQIDLDYIKQRDVHMLKAVNIQELAPNKDEREAPIAVPIANSYIESKPGLMMEKYSLLTNLTVINRKSGLQYRRASVKPAIEIPYNLNGNLFSAAANIQGDFYNLEDSYYTRPADGHYNSFVNNYRPLASFKWSLPLIRKTEKNTIIIEPMANFVTSNYRNNYTKIPNEDSNSSELTQSNLFSDDRFAGFDRNESGQRISYGAKSSLLNSLGLFDFGLGQSYRKNDKVQDVTIRGFNDSNISNIVGQASYKTKKIFRIGYNFHLNESNYRNEINEVFSTITFDKINFYANYLLIRKNQDNPEKREQIDYGTNLNITNNIKINYSSSKNLITGKTLNQKLSVLNDGCCIAYGFTISESNPSNFVKPERSYNINFTIKNL